MNRKRKKFSRFIFGAVETTLFIGFAGFVSHCYGTRTDSTLLEDSLSGSVAEWQSITYEDDPDILDERYLIFLKQYSNDILAAAQRYDVPAVLVDAVIVEENFDRDKWSDWKDTVALAWNNTLGDWFDYSIDASLGVGQVNMSTAEDMDTHFRRSKKTRKEYEEALQNPVRNIEYIAMYLSYLTHRSNRQSYSGSILDNQVLVAVIGTEYVRGPTNTPLDRVGISMEGGAAFAWCASNIPTRRIHGENSILITQEQQDALRVYVNNELRTYIAANP